MSSGLGEKESHGLRGIPKGQQVQRTDRHCKNTQKYFCFKCNKYFLLSDAGKLHWSHIRDCWQESSWPVYKSIPGILTPLEDQKHKRNHLHLPNLAWNMFKLVTEHRERAHLYLLGTCRLAQALLDWTLPIGHLLAWLFREWQYKFEPS